MAYRFHPVALEQQENIWFYTCRTWGEEQANRYITGLHQFIERILEQPDSPIIKRAPIDFATPVYFARFRHHYVFFKRSSDSRSLLILSILHERMDLPTRLQEALNQI